MLERRIDEWLVEHARESDDNDGEGLVELARDALREWETFRTWVREAQQARERQRQGATPRGGERGSGCGARVGAELRRVVASHQGGRMKKHLFPIASACSR